MTIRQSEAHTFIIRIRRQPAGAATGPDEWHGEIVHVPSRRSASFRGLGTVEPLLVRLIATGPPD